MTQPTVAPTVDKSANPRPDVSVVIPCYNRETSVEAAVRSVLEQDFTDIEVIVSDDNSTDATPEILQRIDDPRLRVVTNPGIRGAGHNRNHGVSLARGRWIAFQDSDDLWLPGKLSKQMQRLNQGNYVASYCGMKVKEDAEPGTPVLQRHPDPHIHPLDGDILPSVIELAYLSTQMLVIRRDVFDAVGGFDETLPALEDWELMMRIAAAGPVAFVDEDLVLQRMSANSITRSDKNRVAAQVAIWEKHQDMLQRFPRARTTHLHRIAGGYRMQGQNRRALSYAYAAWKQKPTSVRYFINILYLSLRALTEKPAS